MAELDLRLLEDEGDIALVVPAGRVAAARRRLRAEGREVDVYGLHPAEGAAIAVDLGAADPTTWCFAGLVEPSSWLGLLAQRAAFLVGRTSLRHRLFRTCLVVGRAP